MMSSLFRGQRRLSGAEVLDYIWQLPSDDDDSEAEADEGGVEELQMLDSAVSSLTAICNDTSVAGIEDQASTVFDGTPIADMEDNDHNIRTTIDESSVSHPDAGEASDEYEVEPECWGDETVHFQQLYEKSKNLPSIDHSLKSSDTAGKYFEAVFDSDICDMIVQQTNLYRMQKQAAGSSSIATGADITVDDIKAWIGLCIIMGIHQLPQLQNYWSSDPLLGFPAVSKVMSSKKFKKITEVIHVNDNTTNPPRTEATHDKLHKVRPLIEKLGTRLTALYKPSGTLSAYESMIPFKGRSSMKQYMPMKPVKRGYKVWCLADAVTGFVYTFDVYTGRSDVNNGYTLGERVVLNLCRKATLDPWSIIVFDNFFTTVNLMETLYKDRLFAIGTVRTSRKGLPDMMRKKSKLARGESAFQVKGCVAAIKWMDNKEVTVLSTACDPTEVCSVIRRAKDGTTSAVACPLAISEYNRTMGGVDRFDQLRERYAIGRRSIKWWHRIFYWLIDLAVINSFILYKISRKDECVVDQLSFRLA
jgi:hypothetical protein